MATCPPRVVARQHLRKGLQRRGRRPTDADLERLPFATATSSATSGRPSCSSRRPTRTRTRGTSAPSSRRGTSSTSCPTVGASTGTSNSTTTTDRAPRTPAATVPPAERSCRATRDGGADCRAGGVLRAVDRRARRCDLRARRDRRRARRVDGGDGRPDRRGSRHHLPARRRVFERTGQVGAAGHRSPRARDGRAGRRPRLPAHATLPFPGRPRGRAGRLRAPHRPRRVRTRTGRRRRRLGGWLDHRLADGRRPRQGHPDAGVRDAELAVGRHRAQHPVARRPGPQPLRHPSRARGDPVDHVPRRRAGSIRTTGGTRPCTATSPACRRCSSRRPASTCATTTASASPPTPAPPASTSRSPSTPTSSTSGSSTDPGASGTRERYPDEAIVWVDSGAEAPEAVTAIEEMCAFVRAHAC